MLIQLQLQNLAILKLELELLAIEPWIVLVDNPVVIGTDDNDVRGVVVLRTSDTGNRRTCRYRNGHSVIQQRPVHRLLQYESFVVIHQSYISFFSCLLQFVFLGSSYPQRLWCDYYPVSPLIRAYTTDNTLFLEYS